MKDNYFLRRDLLTKVHILVIFCIYTNENRLFNVSLHKNSQKCWFSICSTQLGFQTQRLLLPFVKSQHLQDTHFPGSVSIHPSPFTIHHSPSTIKHYYFHFHNGLPYQADIWNPRVQMKKANGGIFHFNLVFNSLELEPIYQYIHI